MKTLEQIEEALKRKLAKGDIKSKDANFGKRDGEKIWYIEGHQAIRFANEVFGPMNWGKSIADAGCDTNGDKPVYWARVEVWVTFMYGDKERTITTEDEGCCVVAARKDSTPAGDSIDTARKGAVTDALKRTLADFGDIFGLQLYSAEGRQEALKKSESDMGGARGFHGAKEAFQVEAPKADEGKAQIEIKPPSSSNAGAKEAFKGFTESLRKVREVGEIKKFLTAQAGVIQGFPDSYQDHVQEEVSRCYTKAISAELKAAASMEDLGKTWKRNSKVIAQLASWDREAIEIEKDALKATVGAS